MITGHKIDILQSIRTQTSFAMYDIEHTEVLTAKAAPGVTGAAASSSMAESRAGASDGVMETPGASSGVT